MPSHANSFTKADLFALLNREIDIFIQKARSPSNSIGDEPTTCDDIFDDTNLYELEASQLKSLTTVHANTTDQGNSLEELVKLLFNRVKLLHNVQATNKEISLGQIDVQAFPLNDLIYDLIGITEEKKPRLIIGECKNFLGSKSKKTSSQKISKEEVEKTCWRTLKGNCLTFMIGYGYTQGAIDEIGYFNQHVSLHCPNSSASLIVPLTIHMLEFVIQEKINFCYFLFWAVTLSRSMSLSNYIRDIS